MRVGVPKSNIHAIEHSRRKALWMGSVVRLAAALEVSPAQLVVSAAEWAATQTWVSVQEQVAAATTISAVQAIVW